MCFSLQKVILTKLKNLGGYSHDFLCKFLRFFVSLGLKILRLVQLKAVIEADINKS